MGERVRWVGQCRTGRLARRQAHVGGAGEPVLLQGLQSPLGCGPRPEALLQTAQLAPYSAAHAAALRRYEILRTCIAELQQAGIITAGTPLQPFSDACCQAEAPEGGHGAAAAANGIANGSNGACGQGGSCCSMDEETEQPQASHLR